MTILFQVAVSSAITIDQIMHVKDVAILSQAIVFSVYTTAFSYVVVRGVGVERGGISHINHSNPYQELFPNVAF